MTDLARQPRLMTLASENVSLHYTNEWPVISPQSLQGREDDPLSSLARANIHRHRYSSQNAIPPHQVAIISVKANQAPRPISLLHIPLELISHIFLYLPPYDIISCACTCRMLYEVCSEPALQYLVQIERCAVVDYMHPVLGYVEHLRILGEREEAWATLDFSRSVQVSVPYKSTGFYDFTGGAFLLGTTIDYTTQRPTGYSYIPLPSLKDAQDQKLEWKVFGLQTQILDVGLAVHEHDLIAALTACVSCCCSCSSRV